MRIGIKPFGTIILILFGAVQIAPAMADAQSSDGRKNVVVEMFLSQACKSSPPAADYLDDLAQRSDLVILTWHVDYWNLLANRKFGRWSDPFSKTQFADRQRAYNRKIRHRGTVFTPQAIINGEASVIGSKREAVEAAIEGGRASLAPMSFAFEAKGDKLAVTIDKAGAEDADIVLVSFYKHSETEISGGDNAGSVFREPNIVTGVKRLGEISKGSATFDLDAPGEGSGCAVLVQSPDEGRILGASYCP